MKTSNYILMLGIMCFLMVLSSCEPLFVPTVEEGKTGTTNGYEWVDLGLPSGVKWATCNMGANSPQESGKEYAWEMFNVRSSWGDKWRMPKGKEFEELEEYCKIVPTMFMGMKGVDCKGPNGNHIFIPLPDGEWSRYWTISLSMDGASAGNVEFYEEGGLFPWYEQSIVDGKCFIRPVLMETKIFSVSYNANGGSGYMKSQMFYDGIRQKLQANAFTREGFVLEGWNTKADGSGTSYKNRQVISISQNVTLYAQWKGEPVVVTFDANGGSGSMEPQVFEPGVSQALNANGFTRANYAFIGWNTVSNGNGTLYTDQQEITITQDITLYAQWKSTTGTENGYEWVDLGLPSGLKWATCNVGAYTPENYGTYFEWGETQPRSNYSWSNYKHCNGSSSKLTKYNTSSDYGTVDNKTTLELSDDAAHVNWGGKWRMPTYNEWDELKNNCTWKWTTQNGVIGYKVTSKTNGNSIFLPATGFRRGTSVVNDGSIGYYWSSSLYESEPSYAYGLYFDSGSVYWGYSHRSIGHTVRAVCP